MAAQTQRGGLAGPAGYLETLIDTPQGVELRGTAVVAHPHPLFGGTMDNKVVHTLARACVQSGWRAVRFNFRGVGGSEGVYDEGRGETQDLLAVVAAHAATGPMVLAGFSFGAFVTCQALSALWERQPEPLPVQQVVLVGTAASRFEVPPVPAPLQIRTLVVHGEDDDTVPLADAMRWARAQGLPVTVVPGAGHFFHGQLPLLRDLVARHLRSA